MNSHGGKIWYSASIDNSGLRKGREEARRIWQQMEGDASISGLGIQKIWHNVGNTVKTVLSTSIITEFAGKMFRVRAAFQDAESALKLFLGSAEKASIFLNKLQDYAWYNAFEFSDLVAESKQLLAYGNAVESVIPTLDRLSNIAITTHKPLGDLVDLYNKAKNIGSLDAVSLQQWASAGLVVTDVLKDMGVQTDSSKVSFEQLELVLDKVTSEGGRFYNQMKEMMPNLSMSLGQLQDDWTNMFAELGEMSEGVMKSGIEFASTLVANYEKIGKALLQVIQIAGTYRAVVAVNSAINRVQTNYQYDAEITELQRLISTKQQSTNADIDAALASRKLSDEKYNLISALRAEAANELRSLQIKQQIAQEEAAAADEEYKKAVKKALDTKSLIEQRKMELSLAILSGNAAKIELAQKALLEAQDERRIAVKARKAAADELDIANSKRHAASTAAETLQQNINTISTGAAAKAKSLLSIATTRLTLAVRALGVAFTKNPLGMFVTVVFTALTAFHLFKKRVDDSTRSLGQLEQAVKSETDEVNTLAIRLTNTNTKEEEREKIIKRLKEIQPSFVDGINSEAIAYQALTERLKEYNQQQIIKAGQARLIDEEGDVIGNLNTARSNRVVMESEANTVLRNFRNQVAREFEKNPNPNYFIVEEIDKILTSDLGVRQKIARVMGRTRDRNRALNLGIDYAELRKIGNGLEEVDKEIIRLELDADKASVKIAGFVDTFKEVLNNAGINQTDSLPTLDKLTAAAREAVAKANTELQKLKSGEIVKATAEEQAAAIEAAEKTLNEAQGRLNTILGIDPKKYKEAAEQAEKNANERAVLERRYEDEVAQARIDAMADGLDKTLAQNALNFEREKAQIEEQYAELSTVQRQALVDAAEARKNRADSVAYSEAFAFDWDAEMASLNEYLIEYGSYQEKRLGITQKYADLIAKAQTSGEKLSLERQQQEALDDLDVSLAEQSELWGRLFGDMRNMSAKTLKKVIADTKALLAYLKTPKELRTAEAKPLGFTDEQLDALSGDAEKIKAIYDELIQFLDELENRSNYPFSNIVKGFGNLKKAIKGVNDEGEALTFEDQEAAKKRGLDQLSNGAVELTGFLSGAVDKMKELAELTGDSRLASFADQTGAFLQNVGAAAQGFASGGPIGAIIGGVTDMISQTVEGAAHVAAYLEQAKLDAEAFKNAIQMLELDRLVGDNDNIFGTNVSADVKGLAKKAAESARLYDDAVNKELGKFEGDTHKQKSWGAAIFGFGVSGTFGEMFGLQNERTKEYKSYLDAVKKGYNDLEAMQIKTKDFSGWQEFWGKKDEYKSLKDLAPELWNDGIFDTEAAKVFLETNTQLTDEQRAQIQNVVDLKDAYDEAMTAIEDHVKNIIGDLSSNVGDKMLDNLLAGRDVLADMDDIVQDFGRNFAKSMIQDHLLKDIFNNDLEKLVVDKFISGDTEAANELLKNAVSQAGELAPVIEQIIASLGLASDVADRTASSKGIATASQDSVDYVSGMLTLSTQHTRSIMESNQILVQQSAQQLKHLANIEANTYELHAMRTDLAWMREDIGVMRGDLRATSRTVDDIKLKGIPLK